VPISDTYPRETREFVGVLVFMDETAFVPTKLQVVRRFDRPADADWLDPQQIAGPDESTDYGFYLDDPWLPDSDPDRVGTWSVWAKADVPAEGSVVMLAGRFTLT